MEERSPDAVLKRLKEGNERFQRDSLENSGRDQSRRAELVSGQHPLAIILTCADSRVVPDVMFDTGLGELFVVRVAGNVANMSTIASIEYAAAHLGPRLIVVLGHESCGAVTGAIEKGSQSKHQDHLLGLIGPAIETASERSVNAVARRNAALQAEALVRESGIIRKVVESDGVRIVAAFYHLDTGAVEFD
jgi:carbonic anhydrase